MHILKIDEFIDYSDLKDITKNGYKQALVTFEKYLVSKNILQPKRSDIIAYKKYLQETNHASSTIKLTISVIKNYFKWIKSMGYGEDISYGIKSTKVSTVWGRQALSLEDSRRLLERAKRYANTLVGLRNYCVVSLLMSSGMRTIELERADVEDLDIIDNTYILYIQGKGRDAKDTYIKIPDVVYKLINEYLEMRAKKGLAIPENGVTPLFLDSSNKRRMTKIMARIMIKDLLREIGLDSRAYSAHSLRHSYATNQIDIGTPLIEIKEAMRHSNIAVTQVYLHVHAKMKQNLNEKIADKLFEEKGVKK
jgi:site-specific recombinase XerD